ncbi:MAG: hypothetical protein IJX87_05815 [Clostridia bacterium]|nr:hypothetical protein [Clostridia bacterium]
MTQEKMRKVISASVAAATLLLVILLGFLVYQGIRGAVLDKRIAKLETEIAVLEEQLETGEKDVAFYESEAYLKWAIEELKALKGQR